MAKIKPKEQEDKIGITFRTDPEMKARLNETAKNRGISVSSLINLSLYYYYQYVDRIERERLRAAVEQAVAEGVVDKHHKIPEV